jgi:Flp pilus assembly protein TadD
MIFLLLHGLGVVLFFVNSRYRLPMWPAMAVLAAGAPFALKAAWQTRRHRRLIGMVGLAIAIATLSLVDGLAFSGRDMRAPPNYARDYFFRSLAHLEKGQLEAAMADARRSVELEPGDAAAHFQLGNLAFATDDYPQAYASYRDAARLAPREPRIYNNLAILHERSGRSADAYRGYLYALEIADTYAPALVNVALLELRAGLPERAAGRIARARDLGFDSVPLLCARALLAHGTGRGEEFRRLLTEAQHRDPEVTARLLGIHQQQPLTAAEIDRFLPSTPAAD